MRQLIAIAVLILLAGSATFGHFERESTVPIQPFDAWENICWDFEKTRLDNFAIQLRNDSSVLGYIIVYAGRESCADEAVTRALRAKRWLEKRGVPAKQIVWRNGGFREQTETKLWIWPVGKGLFPVDPNLAESEVKIVRSCKGRILNPVKCK